MLFLGELITYILKFSVWIFNMGNINTISYNPHKQKLFGVLDNF